MDGQCRLQSTDRPTDCCHCPVVSAVGLPIELRIGRSLLHLKILFKRIRLNGQDRQRLKPRCWLLRPRRHGDCCGLLQMLPLALMVKLVQLSLSLSGGIISAAIVFGGGVVVAAVVAAGAVII